MAILGFSGFTDLTSTAAASISSTDFNRYLLGKFPFASSSQHVSFAIGGSVKLRAENAISVVTGGQQNEYGVLVLNYEDFLLDKPVGTSWTVGYSISCSSSQNSFKAFYIAASPSGGNTQAGMILPTNISLATNVLRYIEIRVLVKDSTHYQVTVVVDGVNNQQVDYLKTDFNGKKMHIGYSQVALGSTPGLSTAFKVGSLVLSSNSTGVEEFRGKPVITRATATMIDKGSWNVGSATPTQIKTLTDASTVDFGMSVVSGVDAAVQNNTLGKDPLIFKIDTDPTTIPGVITAIAVTTGAVSKDTTLRTPLYLNLKKTDGSLLASGKVDNLSVSAKISSATAMSPYTGDPRNVIFEMYTE